ncbi:MAG: aldo/keto reductase [Chromatiales bacterium]|nr:aldo/keto reductase [Chromatiales bacterium]
MKRDVYGITRRGFLLGGAAALMWGGLVPVRGAETLLERAIPSSGERLPLVGLGTARSFDVGPSAEQRLAVAEVLRSFVALGGRLVDTSPMYGRAEAVVGELSRALGVGDRLFMATKVWTEGRDEGIAQMERSMDLLGTRPMDLMQIHNLLDWQTQLRTLRAWKEAGKIRYIGITHYVEPAFDDLAAVIRKEPLDFVQLPFSMGEPEAQDWLLDLCADRGCAVIVNRPFQRGALFRAVRGKALPPRVRDWGIDTWGKFFLKFILGHPAVTCAIPATSKVKHVADNLGAAKGYLPNVGERAWMMDYLHSL